MFTVSVVIYNQTLKSVHDLLGTLAQNEDVSQVILVNNGPDLIDESASCKKISIINSRNNGYGSGHNISLKLRVGAPLHVILNPDVVVPPEFFDTLRELYREDPDFSILGPKVVGEDLAWVESARALPLPAELFARRFGLSGCNITVLRSHNDKRKDPDIRSAVGFVSGCAMVFNFEVLPRDFCFDDRYFMYMEDVDVCREAALYGPVVYDQRLTIQHRGTYASRSFGKLFLVHCLSVCKYFMKWGWR